MYGIRYLLVGFYESICIILDYVQNKGGEKTMQLLQGALK